MILFLWPNNADSGLTSSRFIYDPTAGIIKSQKLVGYPSTLTIPQEVLPPVKRTGPPLQYQLFGGKSIVVTCLSVLPSDP